MSYFQSRGIGLYIYISVGPVVLRGQKVRGVPSDRIEDDTLREGREKGKFSVEFTTEEGN